MMEEQQQQRSSLRSTAGQAGSMYDAKSCSGIMSTHWMESAQRQCLPSLMRGCAKSRESNHTASNLQLPAPTEMTQFPHRTQAAASGGGGGDVEDEDEGDGGELAQGWMKPVGVVGATLTPGPEVHRKMKISLAQRWRPYANGAVRRYSVSPRVYSVPKDDRDALLSPVRSLDEMAQCLAQEKNCRGLRHDEFAPQTTLPRQLLARPRNEDPRMLLSDVSARWKLPETVNVPLGLVERTRLFGVTLGAVRPYVLGDNTEAKGPKLKRDSVFASMPPSVLTRDPMEVFVEVMRYQRPAVGVFTFDVY